MLGEHLHNFGQGHYIKITGKMNPFTYSPFDLTKLVTQLEKFLNLCSCLDIIRLLLQILMEWGAADPSTFLDT